MDVISVDDPNHDILSENLLPSEGTQLCQPLRRRGIPPSRGSAPKSAYPNSLLNPQHLPKINPNTVPTSCSCVHCPAIFIISEHCPRHRARVKVPGYEWFGIYQDGMLLQEAVLVTAPTKACVHIHVDPSTIVPLTVELPGSSHMLTIGGVYAPRTAPQWKAILFALNSFLPRLCNSSQTTQQQSRT